MRLMRDLTDIQTFVGFAISSRIALLRWQLYKDTKMEIDNSLEFFLKLKVFLMPVLAEVSTIY